MDNNYGGRLLNSHDDKIQNPSKEKGQTLHAIRDQETEELLEGTGSKAKRWGVGVRVGTGVMRN